MNELEAKRLEIAIQICDKYGSDNWTDLPEGERQDIYQLADQILAIKLGTMTLKEWIELYDEGKLRIEADDQSLPELICKDIQMPVVRQATGLAQQEMLTPDSEGNVWVKVLQKE